jgi:hypothetical protein
VADLVAASFTASRDLDDGGRAVILNVLTAGVPHADRYITGGCIGGDAFIGHWLFVNRPEAKHHVIVPANRSRVDEWWLRIHRIEEVWLTPRGGLYRDHTGAVVEIICMPQGTTYAARNAMLVKHGTMTFGFPAYPEGDGRSLYSGTWQTIGMARKAGKLCRWDCVKPPYHGKIEAYPSALLAQAELPLA